MSPKNSPWIAICKPESWAPIPEGVFVSHDYDDVLKAAAGWWEGHDDLTYDASDPRLFWDSEEIPVDIDKGKDGKVSYVAHCGGDGPTIIFMQATNVRKDTQSHGVVADLPTPPSVWLHDEAMVQMQMPIQQTVASDVVLKAMAKLRTKTNEDVRQAQLQAEEDQSQHVFLVPGPSPRSPAVLEERKAYEKFRESISKVVGTDDIPTFEQWAERSRGRRDPALDDDDYPISDDGIRHSWGERSFEAAMEEGIAAGELVTEVQPDGSIRYLEVNPTNKGNEP